MIIRGRRPTDTYTVVPNHVIDHPTLSWRARGILAYLLSKPDGWRTSSAHLAKQAPEGLHAVRVALSELENAGYLARTRIQSRDGRWGWHTVVYETPLSTTDRTCGKDVSQDVSPKCDSPTSENRAS